VLLLLLLLPLASIQLLLLLLLLLLVHLEPVVQRRLPPFAVGVQLHM
jgi:hypothetical protein